MQSILQSKLNTFEVGLVRLAHLVLIFGLQFPFPLRGFASFSMFIKHPNGGGLLHLALAPETLPVTSQVLAHLIRAEVKMIAALSSSCRAPTRAEW